MLKFFFPKKIIKVFQTKLRSESEKKSKCKKILLWLIGRRSVSWTEDGL